MKLKAFTLIEVLIAMGISLLLIFFVYSGYLFYKREFDRKELKSRKDIDLLQLDEVLQEDFFRADRVLMDGESIRILLPAKQVSYEFGKEFVRRIAELGIDSFKVSVLSLRGGFLKDSQSAASDGTIDKLTLYTGIPGREMPLSYFKKYSPEQLITVNSKP